MRMSKDITAIVPVKIYKLKKNVCKNCYLVRRVSTHKLKKNFGFFTR